MAVIIETIDATARGIEGTDTEKESDLRGDAEVETANIVTGETTLIELEGAARKLLTLGPVAEEMVIPVSQQADLRASRQPKSV